MSVIFSLQHEEAGVNLNKERTVLFEIKAKAAWNTQPIFCGVLCRWYNFRVPLVRQVCQL